MVSNIRYDITVSIVTYNENPKLLGRAIESVLNTNLNVKLFIVNNSPNSPSKKYDEDSRVVYIQNSSNYGFGKAHNQVLKKILDKSHYHLVLNPDVSFKENVLQELLEYLDARPRVGVVMPKVLYPDNSIQYNCKLLPTPVDLITRRFLFFIPNLVSRVNYKYEMRFADYNREMEVPILSGCFMLLRTEALKKIGLFDERFFLFLEDVDFSRRMSQYYKNMYFPKVHIYHHYAKGSYKSMKLLWHHIASAFKYFYKWGWIDRERAKINKIVKKKFFKGG